MSGSNTSIKKGATLGANCTIICGVTIGKYAFIGAGAVINKNVPNYVLMVGVPGKQIGWMSEFGEQLDLPLISKQTNAIDANCNKTNKKYQLSNGIVSKCK